MLRLMRTFVFLALLIGTAWAADQFAFDGRYGRTAWLEAQHQGQQLKQDVDYWLRRTLGI